MDSINPDIQPDPNQNQNTDTNNNTNNNTNTNTNTNKNNLNNFNINTDIKQPKHKTLKILPKLTSIYNSESPIFIELFKTFSEENLDEVTQLKIERFLMNQAQILTDQTLARNRTGNTISNGTAVKGIFVTKK